MLSQRLLMQSQVTCPDKRLSEEQLFCVCGLVPAQAWRSPQALHILGKFIMRIHPLPVNYEFAHKLAPSQTSPWSKKQASELDLQKRMFLEERILGTQACPNSSLVVKIILNTQWSPLDLFLFPIPRPQNLRAPGYLVLLVVCKQSANWEGRKQRCGLSELRDTE